MVDRIIYPEVGDLVYLADEPDCFVPEGEYVVSQVNDDGSFHVGGTTAIWPRRILSLVPFSN